MKEVPLVGYDGCALVDDQKFSAASRYLWRVSEDERGKLVVAERGRGLVALDSLVMGWLRRPDRRIHHANGDFLDCQSYNLCANLSLFTKADARHIRRGRGYTTRHRIQHPEYALVYWIPGKRLWVLRTDGRDRGRFETANQAYLGGCQLATGNLALTLAQARAQGLFLKS